MGQRTATRVNERYPIIKLTEGQEAAFVYLLGNTKQGLEHLYQVIFDAGLVRAFEQVTSVHGEYLEEVATGAKEGDNGENAN